MLRDFRGRSYSIQLAPYPTEPCRAKTISAAPANREIWLVDSQLRLLGGFLALFQICRPFVDFTSPLFDKSRELDSSILRNLDVGRSSANAHCRNRGIDLHIATVFNADSYAEIDAAFEGIG